MKALGFVTLSAMSIRSMFTVDTPTFRWTRFTVRAVGRWSIYIYFKQPLEHPKAHRIDLFTKIVEYVNLKRMILMLHWDIVPIERHAGMHCSWSENTFVACYLCPHHVHINFGRIRFTVEENTENFNDMEAYISKRLAEVLSFRNVSFS